jgi:glycosyltransferase involved in cell wall biosynthesis
MISVLLPTYNACHTIRHSIKSIINQTFSEYELLILDDGSTDATSDVVRSFIDQRIRYVPLPHQGIALTLNEGLRIAKYDIIARMDADDISMPTRLADQYQFLVTKKTNTVISCNYALYRNGRIQYCICGSGHPGEIKKRLALHPDISHPGTMFYKNFIIDSGMYHDRPLEDYDLWLRIKDHAEFHILKNILVLIGQYSTSLTNNNIHRRYENHYTLQEPYFINPKEEFGLEDRDEEVIVRGWREYFYGEPARARIYWNNIRVRIIYYPRIMLAYILTYLPVSILLAIKEQRIKQRLRYFATYFSTNSASSRIELRKYFK